MGVDITAGEHTVRLKYTPEGLYLGILISVVAIAMMILLCAMIKTGIFKFEPELYKEPEEIEETEEETSSQTESIEGIPLEELPEKDLTDCASDDTDVTTPEEAKDEE